LSELSLRTTNRFETSFTETIVGASVIWPSLR
jgi:hypothetical protein